MGSQPPVTSSPPAWLADPHMQLRLGEAATALQSLTRATIGDGTITGERICNDTRLLQPGDIFIALGDRRDGHDFVPEALARGAAFVIVSNWPLVAELPPHQGVLIVRDVDAALARLAAWWRSRYPIPTVGIGGGVGKTTTKETIAGLLAQRYSTTAILKTPANWNDMRGVSLTLLGLRDHHQRAIIEMGMDRPSEVSQLAAIVQPRWGVVTSVSATHLEFFPSMNELIATERGMVESLPSDGLALLNDNHRLVRGMYPYATAPVFAFGTLPQADLRGQRMTSRGTEGLRFSARYRDTTIDIRTTLLGRHLVTAALAALSVALADGWSLADAATALSEVTISQRLRLLPGINGSTVLDDTYNASPESMVAALDMLTDWPRDQGGRRLAFLGTMRELGPRSQREHHRLGRRAAWRCSTLWVTGEERAAVTAGALAGGLTDVRSYADPAEAAADCRATLANHDTLLVKASHAVGLDKVIAQLTVSE